MPTFLPLKALRAWYDDAPGIVVPTLYLLDATVTDLSDTYTLVTELPGLLPGGVGGYEGSGIYGGSWPLNYDSDAGVMELSLPGPDWSTQEQFSLTFRWIAFTLTGGILLTVVDMGAAQTLDHEPLRIYADESAYIPGSYPVFQWRRA